MRRKLRSRRGETLIESLVALLLVSIASVALIAMVTSASRMNKAANQLDSGLYAAVSAAEVRQDNEDKEDGTVTVTVDGDSVTKDVTFYGSGDASIFSYQQREEAGG